MSELKRTQLYDVHVAAGAEMVDFGGWEMPIQYPAGIIAEHLYTRQVCSLFDVSHMGRLLIEGPERQAFLQHVLTSNVAALDVGLAQYCIIANENGGAAPVIAQADAKTYYFIQFITFGLFGLMNAWVLGGYKETPEEMAQIVCAWKDASQEA